MYCINKLTEHFSFNTPQLLFKIYTLTDQILIFVYCKTDKQIKMRQRERELNLSVYSIVKNVVRKLQNK